MNVKPYPYQEVAYEFALAHDYAALFMETGTGKTLVTLMTFEELYRQGVRRFVGVVPNELTGTWLKEAQKFDLQMRILRLESGDAKKRIKLIESRDWDFLLVNYQALRNPAVVEAIKMAMPGALCFDEFQALKDRKSVQTKACRQIAEIVAATGGKILGLTGTPVVHSPLDLWSEFDVLRPTDMAKLHVLGYGNYWGFECGVSNAIVHPYVPHAKIYEFPDEKLATLKERVAPLAVEATKAECLSLPPRHFHVETIEMLPEQARLYKALQDDYITFLDGVPPPQTAEAILSQYDLHSISQNPVALASFAEGAEDFTADRRVSVTFAHTLMIRLQQIAAGHVKTDDGTVRRIENAKINFLTKWLPLGTSLDGDHKTIIFCRFVEDVRALRELCQQLNIGYVALTGKETSDNAPDAMTFPGSRAQDAVDLFQTSPAIRVFIGNAALASKGLTLTAADFCVFYDNSFNAEHRLQGIDRCYRIGQTREVNYIDLVCKNTIDVDALANLNEKQSLSAKTVSGLKAVLLGLAAV